LQGLRASLLERHAERVEDLRRDALLLAEKAEKQMLRADVGVAEVAGLGHRELEHLLGTARIGQLAERDGGLPLSDGLLHALVDLIEIHAEIREHGRRDALALADQAEQNVLRTDIVV